MRQGIERTSGLLISRIFWNVIFMILKIISAIFGFIAVGIFFWKFKKTPLCSPWIMLAVAGGVGYAAYWILTRFFAWSGNCLGDIFGCRIDGFLMLRTVQREIESDFTHEAREFLVNVLVNKLKFTPYELPWYNLSYQYYLICWYNNINRHNLM